jgi:hypothetical protein
MNLINFKDHEIYEFKDYNFIEQNKSDLNGLIVYFPFKDLSYKSFNFFWYIPNQNFSNINIIESLLDIIIEIEGKYGTTFIEGVEIRCDGDYKLNFINLKKLKYKFTIKELKDNLELIYLELFL